MVCLFTRIIGPSAVADFVGSYGANKVNQDIAQKAEDAIIKDLRTKKLIDIDPPHKNPRKATNVSATKM